MTNIFPHIKFDIDVLQAYTWLLAISLGSKMRAKVPASQSQRIADPILREAVFNRRKNALFRRATELSNMCDCEVAVIVFTADGELAQYNSSSMEDILRRYGRACTELHEVQTREAMNKRAADNPARKEGPAKKRVKSEAAEPAARGGRSTGDQDTAEAILSMLDMPLEQVPGGKVATEEMDREFNKLIEDRAKRAQQAAGGAGNGTATRSGSASDKEGAEAALAAALAPAPAAASMPPPPTVAPAPAAAAAVGPPVAGGPASAIESLAAMLAGNPTPSRVTAPGTIAVIKSEEDKEVPALYALADASNQIHPTDTSTVQPPVASNVKTPSVAAAPPIAGSADGLPPLGPAAAGNGEEPQQGAVPAGGV